MPVRNIRPTFCSATGFVPSKKLGRNVAYESRLERDLIILLEMDYKVSFYEEQPITINLCCDKRHFRKYTPDFFVRWIDMKSEYIEVKPDKAKMDEEKWRAMESWCYIKGHSFRVEDANSIRGDVRLKWFDFLHPYLRNPVTESRARHILERATQSPSLSVLEFSRKFSFELSEIYFLMAAGELGYNCSDRPGGSAVVCANE